MCLIGKMRSLLCLALTAALLAGCAEGNPSSGARFGAFRSPDLHRPVNADPSPAAPSPFLRGTAQVVSIDPTTGSAMLNYNGQQVMAYWQTETSHAQVLPGTRVDPQTPPGGKYLQPEVLVQAFPAKPGDIIAFMGMQTGASIFLQGVAVIGH
jgi:hypothetical protein